jgi:hypothetical protein
MVPRDTICHEKAPNPIDKHVGRRVRMRRQIHNRSQPFSLLTLWRPVR